MDEREYCGSRLAKEDRRLLFGGPKREKGGEGRNEEGSKSGKRWVKWRSLAFFMRLGNWDSDGHFRPCRSVVCTNPVCL